MFYPVGATPVQLATPDQMSALLTNTGPSPVFLYRGSSVSAFAYDMILPGGGASLQWPTNSELWAVTAPGVAATTVSLLFTAGATFTPAPTKVEVVSGTTGIASGRVIDYRVPTVFDVSSAEFLYFSALNVSNLYTPMAAQSGGVAGGSPPTRTEVAADIRKTAITILAEWGVPDGNTFTVFSTQTFSMQVGKFDVLTNSADKFVTKLTVAGPSLRLTVTPENRAAGVQSGTATISLLGIKSSATVSGVTPQGFFAAAPPVNTVIKPTDPRLGTNTSEGYKWGYVLTIDRQTWRVQCNNTSIGVAFDYYGATSGGSGYQYSGDFGIGGIASDNINALIYTDRPLNGATLTFTRTG